MRRPITKTITYDTGFKGMLDRKTKEKTSLRGWNVIAEEEVSKYSGLKGCLLFLIFPPLAFFGGSKKIKVTYER